MKHWSITTVTNLMRLNNNIESPHSQLDVRQKNKTKHRFDIALQFPWKQLLISPHNLSGSIVSTFLFLLASVFIFPFQKKKRREFCGTAGEPELKTRADGWSF